MMMLVGLMKMMTMVMLKISQLDKIWPSDARTAATISAFQSAKLILSS